MRRGNRLARWRLVVGVACLVLAVSVPSIAMGATLAPVYRFFRASNGTHFYTASEAEKNNVVNTMSSVYQFEGVAYTLEVDNPQMNAPLYRFFNRNTGSHFYTASEAEKNSVIANLSNVFTYEGPAYKVALNPTGNTPVYRFYNKANGSHFYTISEAEKNNVIAKYAATYNFEGPVFYLAYSTTPPPAGDTTPPTTTTDLKTVYRGLATIRFFATDNAGGSGVDRTFYDLDGLGAVQGTIAYENSLGVHSIEYWSVDEAGNEETHHFATFTIVSVHSEPDIPECTDCHTGDLMSTHDSIGDPGPGCVACHGTGITPSFVCSDCHGGVEDPATHPNLGVVHDGSAETCTDAACHNNDVSVIHDTMLSNGLTPPGCAACHAEGVTPSTVCADCHAGYSVYHPALGATVHKVTGFCYTSGCHVTYGGVQRSDATLLHNTWAKNPGCPACHGEGVEPTLTCFDVDCHGAGGMTLETTHAYEHVDASGDNSGGCTACHGTDIPSAHEAVGCTCHTATYLNDLMAPLLAAGEAECLDCHTDPMDPAAAHPYHVGAHETLETAIEINSAGCVSCHGSDLMAVLPEGNPVTGVSEHNYCSCHEYGEAEDQQACEDCHVSPMDATATYPYHVGDHSTLEAGIAGTVSSACVSCHGTNLLDVDAGSLHLAGEHKGCLCHAYGEAIPDNDECVDCHSDTYAPHGFVDGFGHTGEGWEAAGGHNTSSFDVRGATEKFDGSEGVTLYWESHITSASLSATWEVEPGFQWATAPDGWAGQPIAAGDEGVVSTDWEFPEVNVFWEVGDPAAPEDALFLDATSVVTCQDCHTGLAAAGPHGADDNWALDPDYPADYSMGELTKQVATYPSGIKLRSTLTTATQTYGDGMTLICSKCHDLQNYQSGTTQNNPLPLISTGDVAFEFPASSGVMWDPIYIDASGTRSDGFYVWTRNDGTQVDPASITISGAVGSQTWSSTDTQAQAWIQGAAGTTTSGTIGSSNTAHSSHHQDTNDGSAQCVGCHIGIPHGWKRPRLLVNSGWNGTPNSIGVGYIEGDQPPYKDPDMLGTSRTNGGIYINPLTGYNGMGMLTLSAVDNHNLWAGSGSATDPAKQYYTGAAYWSEPSCQACNDHAGEDGIRIIDTEATTYGP